MFLSLLGFIKSYFDSFYDEEIITEESFNTWESSYEEETGKGLAIGASSEFFRWLRSAANDLRATATAGPTPGAAVDDNRPTVNRWDEYSHQELVAKLNSQISFPIIFPL